MNLSKIALAGCFVIALTNLATADEVRVDTVDHQDVVVRPDDNHRPRPVEHDAAWWRHHHHDHHDDDHARIDINVGH